jgi:hypothetical protein
MILGDSLDGAYSDIELLDKVPRADLAQAHQGMHALPVAPLVARHLRRARDGGVRILHDAGSAEIESREKAALRRQATGKSDGKAVNRRWFIGALK